MLSRRQSVLSVQNPWQDIKETAYQVATNEIHPSVPPDDLPCLQQQMALCVHSPGGEVTARAQTAELGRTYLRLNETGRAAFLRLLAGSFDLDHQALAGIAKDYCACTDADAAQKLEVALRHALVAPRTTILRQLTALPDGFKFLVNMRADLQPLIGSDAALKGLEFDLKTILSSWFDVGLLDLVELSWSSPAALLEKLIEYEAVHPIASWDDLKNRLDIDRRVFAFFHNKMPSEPLIFVHVALVKGMSDNVQALLDEKSPVLDVREANSAIFYSISNAQKGLAGISFGNFLIKRVVSRLAEDLPHIKSYATLSPIPGLRAWLDPLLQQGDESILLPAEQTLLRHLAQEDNAAQGLLRLMQELGFRDAAINAALKPILLRLGAHYLLEEKKAARADVPAPLDPVANFHLFNGARLERINWMGDFSARGLKQSAGLMVNYNYDLAYIDANHEEFVVQGQIVASGQVRRCLD